MLDQPDLARIASVERETYTCAEWISCSLRQGLNSPSAFQLRNILPKTLRTRICIVPACLTRLKIDFMKSAIAKLLRILYFRASIAVTIDLTKQETHQEMRQWTWTLFTTTSYTHSLDSTKYNRLVHKFRHRSTRLCVWMQVYQIHWNNAM